MLGYFQGLEIEDVRFDKGVERIRSGMRNKLGIVTNVEEVIKAVEEVRDGNETLVADVPMDEDVEGEDGDMEGDLRYVDYSDRPSLTPAELRLRLEEACRSSDLLMWVEFSRFGVPWSMV